MAHPDDDLAGKLRFLNSAGRRGSKVQAAIVTPWRDFEITPHAAVGR
jgi:hypothetical protein